MKLIVVPNKTIADKIQAEIEAIEQHSALEAFLKDLSNELQQDIAPEPPEAEELTININIVVKKQ